MSTVELEKENRELRGERARWSMEKRSLEADLEGAKAESREFPPK